MILLKIEFPLVLLQVKAVGGLNASQTFHNHTVNVSISSPSGEGGGSGEEPRRGNDSGFH